MNNNYQNNLLRRCNELAMRARGRTGTNPNVGAVIADRLSNKILGEGWHRSFGGPHAEVNAIRKASEKSSLQGKTIAVSLEPCNHQGKTPACTAAIMSNGIKVVLVDQIDPNHKMKGRSIDLLKTKKLRVPQPLNSTTGQSVIYPFTINTRFKRPYLRLKMAISADNFIGQPGSQVRISNAVSNRWVHRLRSETQAIMAGTNTLINDNPSLTSRYGNSHQPVRILPDRKGILPSELRVFNQKGDNIVLTTSERSDYQAKILNTDPYNLPETFHKLYNNQIGSILIEGGSQFFTSLFKASLWDELILIHNTGLWLGTGIIAPPFPAIIPSRKIKLGTDTIIFIKNPDCR